MNDFDQVINNVTIFHKMFDIIRIVDPVKKEVVYMKQNTSMAPQKNNATEFSHTCYDFWASGKVCSNCISMRALTERDVFVKFEYAHSKLYMTTVYPLDVPFTGYVVEIIKDVSSSDLIDDIGSMSISDVYKNIESKNHQLITDELTGLFNRRYLTERLPYELVNNNLKSIDSALLMIDIDFFKNVNDVFGHLAGDAILVRFAEILNDCIREDYDWIARFGGEEFIIYLKNIKYNDMQLVCEKIRAKIELSLFKYEDNTIPVTTSIGAAHIPADLIIDYETILKFTDKLLYQAKHNGRNQFQCKEVTL